MPHNATNIGNAARAEWKAQHRALRTGDPFNQWVAEMSHTYADASITAGATTAWTHWVLSSNTSATVTSASSTVWVQWVTESVQAINSAINATVMAVNEHAPELDSYVARQARQINARMSPEERAAREAREAELARKYQAEQEARKVANAKAEVLLRQLLSPEQREDLEKKSCFYLYSKGKKYRIDRGRTGNVKLVDERNQVIESYCIHPQLACPDADTMAAQKLMIETDPESFASIANITRRDGSFQRGRPVALVG